MEYRIVGVDYKQDEKVVLHDSWTREEAVSWAKRYSAKENMGGWDSIQVTTLYQTDVDWEGEPVYAEHIIWSCYQEPMEWSDNAMEEF